MDPCSGCQIINSKITPCEKTLNKNQIRNSVNGLLGLGRDPRNPFSVKDSATSVSFPRKWEVSKIGLASQKWSSFDYTAPREYSRKQSHHASGRYIDDWFSKPSQPRRSYQGDVTFGTTVKWDALMPRTPYMTFGPAGKWDAFCQGHLMTCIPTGKHFAQDTL